MPEYLTVEDEVRLMDGIARLGKSGDLIWMQTRLRDKSGAVVSPGSVMELALRSGPDTVGRHRVSRVTREYSLVVWREGGAQVTGAELDAVSSMLDQKEA